VEEEELISALRDHRFRLGPTAEALGISRASLYVLVDECPRVRKASDLGREEVERVLGEMDGDVDTAAARLEVSAHGLRLRLRDLGLGKSNPGSD
jgi:two-component system nitrogen regulation response regulator GlnG